MEIDPQSPLNLLTELLIPIDPKEADSSEMYVFQSFLQKISDFGWISAKQGQLYFYKSSVENRCTLLYQISKNFRLELMGDGHNFRFIKEDICLSIPREFYELNPLFKKFNYLISMNTCKSEFFLESYVNNIQSYYLNSKVDESSVTKISCSLNNRIKFIVEELTDCIQVGIGAENILFKIKHPKFWCKNENYWIWLDIIINASKL
tara:strand:- start:791 stop:1408 length:618 start_codon:yes stop_codon:yes gene_type:complete